MVHASRHGWEQRVKITQLLEMDAPHLAFGPLHLQATTSVEIEQSIAVFRSILDSGIRIIDTADCYCKDDSDFHANERLVSSCFERMSVRKRAVCVVTKGGMRRPNGQWLAEPDVTRIASNIEGSIHALGDGPIELWLLHSRNDALSIKDTLRPALEARGSGYINDIGLCPNTLDDIEEAAAVCSVAAIQTNFSLWCRHPASNGILSYCEEHNIPFLCAKPLGGPSLSSCLTRIPWLEEIAREKSITVYSLAISWLLHQSPVVVPIISSSSLEHIKDLLTARYVQLTASELRQIDRATASVRVASLGVQSSIEMFSDVPGQFEV